MKYLLIALLLLSTGCDRLKGEKGEKGDSGPGNVYKYSGAISSNNQTVNCSRLDGNGVVTVYISVPGSNIQIPNYSTSTGINPYYTRRTGAVEILNASAVGGFWYDVYVITGAQTVSSSSRVEPLIP